MKYNENIQKKGLYFVLPTLIIYGIFLIYPMLSAFHYSFFKWNMISESKYVGLKHFIRMFGDRRFWNSYLSTIHFTLISISIIIILSFFVFFILLSAMLLSSNVMRASIILWVFFAPFLGFLSSIEKIPSPKER